MTKTTDAIAATTVASPCIGVCQLDADTKLCRGCLRTGSEIGAWRDASESVRREILARIATRLAAGMHPVIQRR